ncbi:bifunctional diguanylate cyclase/phosphodiesterase [Catenovulum adriaticum]|uniref:EAL domain-containing protein n=1 Tax=Catenovulum adriaticum TaxID=2984846 RepID=A0ABY7ALS2_9ALTE|nr:EAL domain-containing protein [Catenovulum sp. TS8]WAJ69266.1 EAL domain-containing protein [Catenovulum sp. TS8]
MFVSIRTKLIAISVLTMIASATALVTLALNEHERLFKQAISQDLLALSNNLATGMIEHFSSTPVDEFAISTQLLQLDHYPYIRYALVLDKNNTLIQPYVNPDFFSPKIIKEIEAAIDSGKVEKLPFNQVNIDPPYLMLRQSIGDSGYPVGTFVISVDYQNQIHTSQELFLSKVIPVTIAIIITIIILFIWLQSSLIRPLIKLKNLVSQVTQTANYQLKSEHSGNDEIASLAGSINKMLNTINQEKQENTKHTNTLIEQQQKLTLLANYDPLTHLPNRKLFLEKVDNMLTNDNLSFAILLLDLDDFKTINDTLGHTNGDKLLKQIAQRLSDCVSKDCTLARIGGDEFAIIIPNAKQANDLIYITQQIFSVFTTSFALNKWQISTSVSIGIAFNQGNQIQLHTLLSNADIAMYKAKANGRNQYVIFADSMSEQQQRRLQIANAIDQALIENEFFIVYQAKVSPTKGAIAMEALLRWKSPTLGFISPAEFIPIAEQSGKITDLTTWLINNGFQTLKQNKALANCIISFNLSTFDILKPSFLNSLIDKIHQYEISPNLLEFEITESIYMENFILANLFIKEIKALGCHIALDDFGTGYSSLSYLTQVSADTLKIDQSFIHNLQRSDKDRQIVEAIIRLAKTLNLTVCAEGVETDAQYLILKQAGCDFIQGYLFSKPLESHLISDQINKINQQLNLYTIN